MSILLSSLLVAAVAASAGGGPANPGGSGVQKPATGGDGSTNADPSRLLDKSRTGSGTPTIPDPNRFFDRPLTGSGGSAISDPTRQLDRALTGTGSSTFPPSSGTFQTEQPRPAASSCSSTAVRIGEEFHSRVHCANSVGGTLK